MGIPQQAMEQEEWLKSQPREGKIDHIPLGPQARSLWDKIGTWIIAVLLFVVLPILASWFVEAITK